MLHCIAAYLRAPCTLQVLGVRSITFMDIIDRHILPAFKSDQACQMPPDILVSYLAFISLSGLLSTSKFDAAPDTTQGKKLLKQLQQCAVICTNRGPVQVVSSEAIHFPVSLGNQVPMDPSCTSNTGFSPPAAVLSSPISASCESNSYTESEYNNVFHCWTEQH